MSICLSDSLIIFAFFGQFGLSVVVVVAAAVVVVRYSVGTSVALDVKHQIPK